MSIGVSLVPPEATRALRELYRQEMDCQIVLDSWHGRGWADSYLLRVDGWTVGYGLVGGVGDEPRETITEFYVLPAHRGRSLPLFRRLIEVSRARAIEAQTNDILLTLMLYDRAVRIESPVILFHDAFETGLSMPGGTFRDAAGSDRERIASVGLDRTPAGSSSPMTPSLPPVACCSITMSRMATSSWRWPFSTVAAGSAAT